MTNGGKKHLYCQLFLSGEKAEKQEILACSPLNMTGVKKKQLGSHLRHISSLLVICQTFHTTFPLMLYNLNSDRLFSHLNYKLVLLQLLFPTETS